MQLRRLVCILRNQQSCGDCWLAGTCAYSCFFETHIGKKDLEHLPGRDRASHPFVMEVELQDDFHCSLVMTFLGRGRNYIPYVNQAIENAGGRGVGRNRSRFKVLASLIDGKEFDYSLRTASQQSRVWPSGEDIFPAPLMIHLETPCRIKEEGLYISMITLRSLLVSEYRRMQLLEELFGDGDVIFPILDPNTIPESEPREQHWMENRYYSTRQKSELKFGGVVGYLFVKDGLEGFNASLLKAMELFHVGKNVSFGLGKVSMGGE